MSPTTSGRRAPRVTARVRMIISSSVTGHGRVVAEHDHRRGVADEDQVDAGLVGDAAGRRVVGGDHHDLVAAPLHLGELGQRELAGGGRAGRGLARAGAHE